MSAVAPLACAALAAVLWVVTVRRADYASMGQLGLVTILGPAYFVGLALLSRGLRHRALASTTRARAGSSRSSWCSSCSSSARACAIEPVAAAHERVLARRLRALRLRPRPPAQRLRRGVLVARRVLALRGRRRRSWASPSVIVLLRWFPLVIELAYLAPMLAIARASGVSRRAGWLGDRALLRHRLDLPGLLQPPGREPALLPRDGRRSCCHVLAPARESRSHAAARRCASGGSATKQALAVAADPRRGGDDELAGRACRLGDVPRLVLVFVASAMSHQLTPYAIVLALAACLLTRRLGRPELFAIAVRCSPSGG